MATYLDVYFKGEFQYLCSGFYVYCGFNGFRYL